MSQKRIGPAGEPHDLCLARLDMAWHRRFSGATLWPGAGRRRTEVPSPIALLLMGDWCGPEGRTGTTMMENSGAEQEVISLESAENASEHEKSVHGVVRRIDTSLLMGAPKYLSLALEGGRTQAPHKKPSLHLRVPPSHPLASTHLLTTSNSPFNLNPRISISQTTSELVVRSQSARRLGSDSGPRSSRSTGAPYGQSSRLSSTDDAESS